MPKCRCQLPDELSWSESARSGSGQESSCRLLEPKDPQSEEGEVSEAHLRGAGRELRAKLTQRQRIGGRAEEARKRAHNKEVKNDDGELNEPE